MTGIWAKLSANTLIVQNNENEECNMSFTKDKGVQKGEKYKYKTRKERVTLRIVDGAKPETEGGNVPVLECSEQTDPLGSYTGKPLDEDDVPVQDVDDL